MAIGDNIVLKLLTTFALALFAFRDSFRFWTPKSLGQYMELDRPHADIIDPNNYLSREGATKIATLMKDVSSYDVSLVIFNGLDRTYTEPTSMKTDLDRFLGEFLPIMIPSSWTREGKLVIFYAVEDDDYRCVIGNSILNKFISQRQCDKIVAAASEMIKNNDYDKGFTNIAEELVVLNDKRIFGGYFNLFAFIALVVGIYWKYKSMKQTRGEKLAKRLDTINNMSIKEKSVKAFLDENCIICLKELETEPENDPKAALEKKSTDSDVTFGFHHVQTLLDSDKLAHSSNLMHTAVLDCGHKFHYKCIKEYKRKDPECPICSSPHVDKKNSEPEFKHMLIDIQKRLFSYWFAEQEIENYSKFHSFAIPEEKQEILRPVRADVPFVQQPSGDFAT